MMSVAGRRGYNAAWVFGRLRPCRSTQRVPVDVPADAYAEGGGFVISFAVTASIVLMTAGAGPQATPSDKDRKSVG